MQVDVKKLNFLLENFTDVNFQSCLVENCKIISITSLPAFFNANVNEPGACNFTATLVALILNILKQFLPSNQFYSSCTFFKNQFSCIVKLLNY